MKTGKAARRRRRDRHALVLAGSGVAAILLLAGFMLWLMPAATPGSSIGGPFTLVADTGTVVTERSFPGKYLAIYFGYTKCEDICPATLTNLAAALARLGQQADRVQPLFITVDPQRDSPPVLQRFVANFSPNLLGLTGTETELRRVDQEFHVVSLAQAPAARQGSYAVDHSSVIYLFAPDGSFLAPIPADASEMVMVQAIARYVKI